MKSHWELSRVLSWKLDNDVDDKLVRSLYVIISKELDEEMFRLFIGGLTPNWIRNYIMNWIMELNLNSYECVFFVG